MLDSDITMLQKPALLVLQVKLLTELLLVLLAPTTA
jgi:hypothetical protein